MLDLTEYDYMTVEQIAVDIILCVMQITGIREI
jgi:hypothetical protein